MLKRIADGRTDLVFDYVAKGRWRLMTAEVRTDKGKFVNSAWAVDVDGQGRCFDLNGLMERMPSANGSRQLAARSVSSK